MAKVDKQRLEDLSHWYTNGQGFRDFDEVLQKLRYKAIKPYFYGKNCLEIAPAQGITTALLQADFEKLDLLDGSQTLLNVIPNYNNTRKFNALVENFTPDTLYDTILMDHLLEHLEFPVETLAKIKPWLAPGGVLIVGVPNAKSFHRQLGVEMKMLDSIYSFNQRDIDLGHFRIYDLNSLQDHAKQAGLHVEHTEGVFFKLLSNNQLGDLSKDNEQLVNGLFELGKHYKELCAEIYIICKAK